MSEKAGEYFVCAGCKTVIVDSPKICDAYFNAERLCYFALCNNCAVDRKSINRHREKWLSEHGIVIPHEWTEDMVCPFCGAEVQDSWEYEDDRGEVQCYDCGNIFKYERHEIVRYSTEKGEKHSHG